MVRVVVRVAVFIVLGVGAPSNAAYLSDFLGVSPGKATFVDNEPYVTGIVHAGGPIPPDFEGFGIGADAPGGFNLFPMYINGVFYNKGIGMHAIPGTPPGQKAQATFHLDAIAQYEGVASFAKFRAVIGVNDSSGSGGTAGDVHFYFRKNGGTLVSLGARTGTESGLPIEIDLDGVTTLTLLVDSQGDDANQDHAVWANAQLVPEYDERLILSSDEPGTGNDVTAAAVRLFDLNDDSQFEPIGLVAQLTRLNGLDYSGTVPWDTVVRTDMVCDRGPSCAGGACPGGINCFLPSFRACPDACTPREPGGGYACMSDPAITRRPMCQPFVSVLPNHYLRMPGEPALDPSKAIKQVSKDNEHSAFYRFQFSLPSGFTSPYLRGIAAVDDQAVVFLNGNRISRAMRIPSCLPSSGMPVGDDPCRVNEMDWSYGNPESIGSVSSAGFDPKDVFPPNPPSSNPNNRRVLTWASPDPFSTSVESFFVNGTNELVFAVAGDAAWFEPTGLQFYAEVFYETGCGPCDDQNACTSDSCDPMTGCVHTPIPCDDQNVCTSNSCNPASGCLYTAIPCDDDNACTSDLCDPMTGCVHTPIPCDDQNACTSNLCSPVAGCVYTPIPCDDDNACTSDTCDPMTGCVYTPIPCNDKNACTTDSCNPMSGCVFTPNLVCNDNDACTTDSCDDQTGCVFIPIPPCSDFSACTIDSCNSATGCTYTPVTCNDTNACTTDTCDSMLGCVYTPVSQCNDNNACTTDSCDTMAGCVFAQITCDDGNACTSDSCNPSSGCVFVDNGMCDGACCNVETGNCIDGVYASDCPPGSTYGLGQSCDNLDCQPRIPTVSEWGLVVLTLFLVAGGKVYFGRKVHVTV